MHTQQYVREQIVNGFRVVNIKKGLLKKRGETEWNLINAGCIL